MESSKLQYFSSRISRLASCIVASFSFSRFHTVFFLSIFLFHSVLINSHSFSLDLFHFSSRTAGFFLCIHPVWLTLAKGILQRAQRKKNFTVGEWKWKKCCKKYLSRINCEFWSIFCCFSPGDEQEKLRTLLNSEGVHWHSLSMSLCSLTQLILSTWSEHRCEVEMNSPRKRERHHCCVSASSFYNFHISYFIA